MELTTSQEYMLKVLDDTAKYYNYHNRSVVERPSLNKSHCLYRSPDGKACAIGRLIPNNIASILDSFMSSGVQEFDVWDLIKDLETIKPAPQSFWKDLQAFHDGDVCWDEAGLTAFGNSQYGHIKKLILKGTYA
jgi:hypothetical protein